MLGEKMIFLKIILVIFLVYLYAKYLLKTQAKYLAFYILPLFMFMWKYISCIYLETGQYVWEIKRYTYAINSDWLFLFLNLPFLLLSPIFVNKIENFSRKRIKKHTLIYKGPRIVIEDFYILIIFIVLGYLFLNLFVTGSPRFNSAIVRFEFFAKSKLPMASFFSNTIMFFLLYEIGKKFFEKKQRRSKKILCLVILFISLVYQFFIGNKFSGMYQYIFFFFIAYFIELYRNKTLRKIFDVINWKMIVIIATVLILFIGVSYYTYANTSSASNPVEMLISRIFALQADAWWGVVENLTKHDKLWSINWSQLECEWENMINNKGIFDDTIGMVKATKSIAPGYIFRDYYNTNTYFSGWYLIVSIMSLGAIGTFIYSIFVSLGFAFYVYSVCRALFTENVAYIFIAIYAYYHFYDYMRVGNFSLVFNIPMLFCFVFLFFLLFVRYKKGEDGV